MCGRPANHDEALASMKTLVVSMEPSAESIRDSDFFRFLQARDFDINKAAKFMVQHLKWRKSFVPTGAIKESEIAKELERKQIFMQGHDKYGCSIVVVLASRHRAFERDLEEVKRFFVYTFDKAAASNLHDQGKFMIIIDLTGWGIKNMDIRGYLAVLDMLQNQYPERLRKLFIMNLPYLFWGAWKIVYPLIDKNTREKVVLVSNENHTEMLLEEIDKDQLPTIYGGSCELVPVQDSVVQDRQK